ncbi:MAG: tetratricopeptide repeat protein [Rickettsiaceae bacterium]
MPDRLICSLGLYYGIEEDSAWNTINQLYTQGIINQRAKENLQYIVTFATTLRLKTYLHNKGQVENISVFADSNLQLDGIFSLSKKDLSEQGSLFKYFYTALPLHDMLKQFCIMHDQNVLGDRRSFFRKSTFYRDDATTKGFIYYKLLQLQEARQYLEQAREVDESPTINYILGRIYAGSGNDALALQHFKLFASKNSESDYVDNRSFVVSQAFKNQNIASILSQMGQDEEAIKILQQNARIYDKYWGGKNHKIIASSFYVMAICNFRQESYDEAEYGFERALKISQAIQSIPRSARCYDMLGLIACKKKQYDNAIDFQIKGLELLQSFYKGQPHLEVTAAMHNLASSYRANKDYTHSIQYATDALKIRKMILGKDHPSLARSMITVSNTLLNNHENTLENLEEAFALLSEAKRIVYTIIDAASRKHTMSLVHNSLFSLGNNYVELNKYSEAIKCYKECLDILPYSLSVEKNASIYKNLGLSYIHLDHQYANAVPYFKQSLDIKKDSFVYKLLGHCYFYQARYTEAKEYYKRSLNIKKDLSTWKSWKQCSFYLAAENNDDIVQKMLQAEEVKQSNNTKTLLIKAICDGNMKEIEVLISKKVDINKADKEGASPLYYSLGYARQPINLNIVKLLLDSNANPNQEMFDGDTPMHMAHYKSNVGAVQLLLEYGANPHQCNHKGKTPLLSLLESDRYTNEEKVQFVNALTQYCGDIFTNSDPISTLYNVILSQVQPLLSEITESKESDRETAVTGKNINSEVASLDDEQAISDLAREVTLSTQENTQELAGGNTEISHELDEF